MASQVTRGAEWECVHWSSCFRKGCYKEVKGTLHERNNETFREFQGRVEVGMTGMAGDKRQTGLLLCLQIYTLHNEQCRTTEDFEGE